MNYPISVGLDVHKRSISAYSYNILTDERRVGTFGSDTTPLIAWLKEHREPYRVVYESGHSGFSLKRTLEAAHITCEIAATSKIDKAKGDRIKTDARNAEDLARLLAAGKLSFVYMPPIDYEGMRDVNRAYVATRDALAAEKQRISKMCDRYGICCEADMKAWTPEHLTWLNGVTLPSRGASLAMAHYLDERERLFDEKTRILQLIKTFCADDELRPTIDALRCLKGIAEYTAFCLLVEIVDFTRFDPPSAFGAFLGMVPSEYSSGETRALGKITKTGNSLVRKAIVESAWSSYRAKRAYKRPVDGVAPEIARAANKANKRLFDKVQGLKAAKKKPCVAVVATARELALWVAAISSACQTGCIDELEGCL